MNRNVENLRWLGIVCAVSGGLTFVLLGMGCLANGFSIWPWGHASRCLWSTEKMMLISFVMAAFGVACIMFVRFASKISIDNQTEE